jgi:hypothetical protein
MVTDAGNNEVVREEPFVLPAGLENIVQTVLQGENGVASYEEKYSGLAKDMGVDPQSKQTIPWINSDKKFIKNTRSTIMEKKELNDRCNKVLEKLVPTMLHLYETLLGPLEIPEADDEMKKILEMIVAHMTPETQSDLLEYAELARIHGIVGWLMGTCGLYKPVLLQNVGK